MKLNEEIAPQSSMFGGGLQLLDDGRPRFMVLFAGTTAGITPEETQALAATFKEWADMHGLSVPERGE